ncbi:MurR/RpiR family transcriptional regulator [Terribacillus saccharophilus]|uniref:MurR/RpiR family transcriptional regulator n=1 Tax=Terribacillus saccharophilus TaxID=361277 RepID=UPI003D28CFFB
MLLNKMKFLNNLTTQEKHIVDFILRDPSIIFSNSAKQVAQLTYTSSPTVVRLCKKLGTKGYPDFQLKLALELGKQTKPDKVPEADDNAFTEMDSILTFYDKALTETRKLLSENLLHNVMERIIQADSIDIYGMDTNYNTAQQASASWNEIGFKSNAFNSINHHYLNQMNKDRNVVSFIISHTGRNKAMIDAAEILQKQDQYCVSISGTSDSPLAKYCDANLTAYVLHNQPEVNKIIYTLSTKYIFDVLYLRTFSKQ